MKKDYSKNTWIVSVAILLLFIIPYLLINHLPLNRRILPCLWGEERIPFIPLTFVVYLSAFIQIIFVVRYMPKELLERLLPMTAILVALHLFIFVVFPTECYREWEKKDVFMYRLLKMIDTSGNSFPSLHVSLTILSSTFYTLTERVRWRKILMYWWSWAIIFSVLTTKQHTTLDIFGAILLTTIVLIVYRRKLKPCY